jgi:3-mercaptopyruvate sulfurtransferase SseA
MIDKRVPDEWLETAKKLNTKVKIIDLAKLKMANEGLAPVDSFGFTIGKLKERYAAEALAANSAVTTDVVATFRDSYLDRDVAWGGATLIDARPASFFLGKEKAPNAAAYGHIPGALSLDSASYYDDKTNRLKPKAELAALSAHVPAGPAVSYCNTGHWAATDWFVLHELLGREDVRLYDGSMVEWTANPNRPVESARTKWDDLKKKLGLGS